MSNELEGRVHKLETYFKVAFGVAAIMGIGGGVGWTLVSAAKSEISSLQEQVEQLRPLVDEIDGVTKIAETERERTITEIRATMTDLLAELETKARQSVRDASSQILQVRSEQWGLSTESGSSTKWSRLPTDMKLELETSPGGTQLYIDVHVSRVQHSKPDVNTEYRIVLDGKEVAKTNTGNHHSWGYRALSFHAVAPVSPGSHTVRIEYKTQDGTEKWYDDSNGHQLRRLSVIEFRG